MRSVGRYAPAVALMGLIFFLSAQSSLPRVESDLDLVLRKGAHMTEYGLLWLALVWAQAGAGPVRRTLTALGIAVAYAISDEVHQSFVSTRHPSPFDVAIDTAGMGVAAASWVLRTRRVARGPHGH